ncbi:replication initiation protein, partial [Azohydromonas aeria]|uniref:replication initiation protein n=1 Tax=Azohydromonas aeria TaxID=2590212 RepID=UPI0012FCEBD2
MAKSLIPARKDSPAGTLNKPVAALAIVPLNKSLTVTARKAYNVMLHIAQRQCGQGLHEGGFSAPLNAILRGFGVGSNIASDAKRYIEQMMSTKIEWRPLSRGEQWSLPAAGAGDGAAAPAPSGEVQDELRMFNMLSEVRLYKKNGENWVTWFYPPTIQQQMLGPNRWARLELETIARLGTYTAVALYEICARYRDNPGGVTSRQHWSWWVAVLKGSELARQREWRKFKNEFVAPAIRDINEASDLEIELLEYKEGRAIAEVQFAVRRKPGAEAPRAEAPQPADMTQVARALALGLREADADAFIDRYGEAAVARALDAMQRQLAAAHGKPILNRAAYLKTILAGLENDARG